MRSGPAYEQFVEAALRANSMNIVFPKSEIEGYPLKIPRQGYFFLTRSSIPYNHTRTAVNRALLLLNTIVSSCKFEQRVCLRGGEKT